MKHSSPTRFRLFGIAAVSYLLTCASSLHAAVFTLTKATIDSCSNSVVDFSKATLGTGAGAVTNTVAPGDTIQIESHTRTRLSLLNLVGTASQKITVTNVPGGQFIIGDVTVGGTTTPGNGLGLWGPRHVILKGTPTSSGDYGIKIAHATDAHALKIDYNKGNYGLYLNTVAGPTDVEITGLEIANTSFDAISAKCDCEITILPSGYIFDGLTIHDNYIHDTGGEAMYLGWTGSAVHEDMSNVLVYDNLLERIGWDGIQLNHAKTGTNAIYNNIILGYGLTSIDYELIDPNADYSWQANGMSIAISKVDIYDNFIATVSGTGSEYQGAGISLHLYDYSLVANNVVALNSYGSTTHTDGIWLNETTGAPSNSDADIVNNTIIRPDRYGMTITGALNGTVNLVNNIIANPHLNGASGSRTSDYYNIETGSNVTLNLSNNLFVSTLAAAGFTDAANNDLTLTASSSAVDSGTNASSYGVTTDIDGITRPQGSAYDIGAYERIATSGGTTTIITPTAVGTATGSSYCPATGAFNEQPTWDGTNSVPSGMSASPNDGTTTAYANRHFYIDFGPDWADVRITGMWTRWRPSSAGTYSGFATMWWDDDTDATNDGTTATGLNFASGTVSGTSAQWTQDADFSSAPVTPQGRYLMVSTGSSPTDRANEFAFSGYIASGYTTTIVTPTGVNTATGSSYCPAGGAFNEQPTWDSTNGVPSGTSSAPNDSTGTAYANRYFYIDLGTNWANIRITGMWTRWRPYSSGTYSGFATMWWDDDTDTTNDGTTATGLNFASGTVPSSGTNVWTQDADFSSAPITPAGRYLMVSTGSSPTDRANEFTFSGYVLP